MCSLLEGEGESTYKNVCVCVAIILAGCLAVYRSVCVLVRGGGLGNWEWQGRREGGGGINLGVAG